MCMWPRVYTSALEHWVLPSPEVIKHFEIYKISPGKVLLRQTCHTNQVITVACSMHLKGGCEHLHSRGLTSHNIYTKYFALDTHEVYNNNYKLIIRFGIA